MTRVLVDTNVLLDVLLDRPRLSEASSRIWSLAETEQIEGYVSAISFNNIYCIASRAHSKEQADQAMIALRGSFRCVDQSMQIINQAIDANLKDFEDAIQYFSAVHIRADFVITRNLADFPKRGPKAITPEDFLTLIAE